MGSEIKWTKQQESAIKSRGDILVTASAGTGKTAVLSRRCVDILVDPDEPVCVNEILVLTFTEAAADEMQTRIAQTLREEYRQSRNPQIYKELLLIDGADICTIHSFCKRIITEYFFQLDLDPSFTLLDSDEQDLIQSEVLQDVVEEAWSDPTIKNSLAQLFNRRYVSDLRSGFTSSILRVSQMLCGVPDKNKWFARCKKEAIDDAAKKQFDHVGEIISSCQSQISLAMDLDAKTLDGFSVEYLSSAMEQIGWLSEALALGDYKQLKVLVRGFVDSEISFPRKKKNIDKSSFEAVKEIAKAAVEGIKGLLKLAVINADYEKYVSKQAQQETETLIELVKRFEIAYALRKRELNCLDFSDLEHYALKLLCGDDCNSETEISQRLKQRYKSIFVDEYQDVNEVQDRIVRAVSGGDNLFVVGDVKQSIYSWRQARPDIFLAHLENASDQIVAGKESKINLNANFRSRGEVIDVINQIFKRLMIKGFGGVNYDENAALVAGADYSAISEEDCAAELHLLCKEDLDGEHKHLTKIHKQGFVIASRIKEMLGDGECAAKLKVKDRDSGLDRDVTCNDIVILMRSLGTKASDLAQILRASGVPVNTAVSGGYFETTEITDCLTLLKVLDNPRNDIEFASVLRSPFFGFSESELTQIRINDTCYSDGYFVAATKYAQENDNELSDKLVAVFEMISKWQNCLRQKTLAQSIWIMLTQSGYLSEVCALANGKKRKANLQKLHDLAIQFEGFVSCGNAVSLSRFVEFVERLLEHEKDWSEACPETDSAGGVRIMSVHKSKGLEFPVVFLAGLDGKFNRTDIRSDCLCSDFYAPGLRIINEQANAKLPTLSHQVIAREKDRVMLHEELRILYVAMTRARERLVMVGEISDRKKLAQEMIASATLGGKTLPAWKIEKSNSHLGWIISSLAISVSSLQMKLLEEQNAFTAGGLRGEIYDGQRLSEMISDEVSQWHQSKDIVEIATEFTEDELALANKELGEVTQNLDWEYEFIEEVGKITKTSVSQLTHRSDEYIERDFSDAFGRKPQEKNSLQVFSSDSRLIGVTSHLVMQKIDLSKKVTRPSVCAVIESLVQSKDVESRIAEKIDVDGLVSFFTTKIAEKINAAKNVFREWPFTIMVNGVIVQGIVDMVIEAEEGIYVVDFKTDQISPAQLENSSNKYKTQLELYCKAASDILGSPLKGGWLYFLCAKSEYKIV